jgi:diguanylate cyclase (GGDEF)-like protein/PAS domain S-box-containing protein
MNTESCAPVLAWMTDRDCQATFVSSAWLQQTGRTIEETLGIGWQSDLHPDDLPGLLDILATQPDISREVIVDFRLKHARGDFRPMSSVVHPYYSPKGKFSGWAGSAVPAGDAAISAVFHLISNNMREIVCLIGPDARILFISRAVETILGYAPDEVIGRQIDNFFVPTEQKSELDEYFKSIRTVDGPQYFEIRLPTRSGGTVWLETDMQFLRDQSGQLINLQIVARNVTLRKQNEEMLRLQNEIASILWENGNLQSSLPQVLDILLQTEGVDCGGIYICDPLSQHMDLICHKGISTAFAQAVGRYSINHPLTTMVRTGRPTYDRFPAELNEIHKDAPEAFKEEDLRSFGAIPVLYKKEMIAIFLLASHQLDEIPVSSRQILEFLARQIGAMIARNLAETALRESEEKFRSFFEQTTDTFSLTDEEGVIIEWNRASEALTGLSQEEAVGRRGLDIQFDLLPPRMRTSVMYQKMKERFAAMQKSGKASFFNHILDGKIVDKAGNSRSFQQLIFPIQTSKGFMLGSSGRDVTHVKEIENAEREQRLLNEALIVSSATLNSSLKLDDVFNSILNLVEEIVPNQGESLMLIDPESGSLRVYGSIGKENRAVNSIEMGRDFYIRDMPVLQHMFDTRKPLIIGDTPRSKMWRHFHSDYEMRSFLGVPICIKKTVIGFLNLTSSEINYFQPKHADWLLAFANQAAMAIENARLFSQVEHLAVQDELTHIYNRRGLIEIGQREVERAQRFDHPLSALFLDVDHFKEINDSYSHSIGDQALQTVSSCFNELMRSVDIIGRYGGEEFVFLLPETDLEGARVIAERLRTEIAQIMVGTPHGDLHVTVSIGVACLNKDELSLETLLERADAAVHRAKAGGRNRVEVG